MLAEDELFRDRDDREGHRRRAPGAAPRFPNRASYYVPSQDRAIPRRLAVAREENTKLRDTRFPPHSPQPSDIIFDVVAARRDDRFSAAAPELKLRPILTTRPPRPDTAGDGGSNAAASPTGRARPPRFRLHAAKGGRGPPLPPPDQHRRNMAEGGCTRRLRRGSRLQWMYESLVVVKESADPEEDFLESMAEMVAANGVRSPRGLEELLACYLALNAADHHRAIVVAFRRAWLHLHLRCMHEHAD
jgi:uncharacterized protein (TIGR01568 family)